MTDKKMTFGRMNKNTFKTSVKKIMKRRLYDLIEMFLKEETKVSPRKVGIMLTNTELEMLRMYRKLITKENHFVYDYVDDDDFYDDNDNFYDGSKTATVKKNHVTIHYSVESIIFDRHQKGGCFVYMENDENSYYKRAKKIIFEFIPECPMDTKVKVKKYAISLADTSKMIFTETEFDE